jgi:hypothetical protein
VKKATGFLLVLLSMTLIRGGQLYAAPQSLQEAITSFMWSWEYYDEGRNKAEPIRFYRDGVARNLKWFTAHWEIDGPRTLVLKMAKKKAVLTFNDDFTSYDGIDFNGKIRVWGIPSESVDPNYAPSNPSHPPATPNPQIAAAAPAKPDQTCVEILSEQAPNALEWALAPLDRTTPPDIRKNLTLLRENLLDEKAKKPAAGAEAYTLGRELCNDLIATLDERDKALVRAGYTAAQANVNMGEITDQALEARRNYQMRWPQFFRERDQRDELRKEKQNGAALTKQRPILEWADRSAQIRTIVDALYAQYREAARRPFASK